MAIKTVQHDYLWGGPVSGCEQVITEATEEECQEFFNACRIVAKWEKIIKKACPYHPSKSDWHMVRHTIDTKKRQVYTEINTGSTG